MTSPISESEDASRTIAIAGAPTNSEVFAKAMGAGWRVGYAGPEHLDAVVRLDASKYIRVQPR